MDHVCLGLWNLPVRAWTHLWRAQPWRRGQGPGSWRSRPDTVLHRMTSLEGGWCWDHTGGGSMPSPQGRCHQPHLLRLLFMGRLYIKCFSFRIGSFNMFCRKLFYVPIKKTCDYRRRRKAARPHSHCMLRKNGFTSPENDTTTSFPAHYGIRQRGAL